MRNYLGLLLCLFLVSSVGVSAQVVNSRGRKIMVFGGNSHDVYLGCLSCSDFARDSVSNEFSPYGSSFSGTSIFNSFSQYGSKFSFNGACNNFATAPPVVVDDRGAYYGELTMNDSRPRRVKSETLRGWLIGVCSSH